MPTSRPSLFLALPPELLVRVFACLSTKERAGLPLVCKALERLANDPCSRLWESLDLRVDPQREDEALSGAARRLLRARGQRTKTLRIALSGLGGTEEGKEGWTDDLFATLLPPLCPQLEELVVASCSDPDTPPQYRDRPYQYTADNIRFTVNTCVHLRTLDIALLPADFAEAIMAICAATGLTRLGLEQSRGEATRAELRAALEPLAGLTRLCSLDLHFECRYNGEHNTLDVPACLPSRLRQLESLCLEHGKVCLPNTFTKLQRLTALSIFCSAGLTNIWPGVCGLPLLRALLIDVPTRAVSPPVMHPTALSSGLTGLTCHGDIGLPEQVPVGGDLLALPGLQALQLQWTTLGSHLAWDSLTALTRLTCPGEGPGFGQFCNAVPGLKHLACLVLDCGEDVTDAVVAELFQQLKVLRRLELAKTRMSVLPEAMASAQLTALHLKTNPLLGFGPEAYRVLERMPALQKLQVCLCEMNDVYMGTGDAAARTPRSFKFLHAISNMDAWEPCRCFENY